MDEIIKELHTMSIKRLSIIKRIDENTKNLLEINDQFDEKKANLKIKEEQMWKCLDDHQEIDKYKKEYVNLVKMSVERDECKQELVKLGEDLNNLDNQISDLRQEFLLKLVGSDAKNLAKNSKKIGSNKNLTLEID